MGETQPVTIGAVVSMLLISALGVAAASGRFVISDALYSQLLLLIAAIVGAINYFVYKYTTPLAKPTDNDGTPLLRADNQEPTELAAAAGFYVAEVGPANTALATAREGAQIRKLVWDK